MPIDPRLSLGVSQPVPIKGPMDNLKEGLQLRALMTQDALRNQQIQHMQSQGRDLDAQAAAREQQVADSTNFGRHLQAAGGSIDKAFAAAKGAGNVSPGYLYKLDEQVNKSAKEKSLGDVEKLKSSLGAKQSISNSVRDIQLLPEDQRALAYSNMMENARANPVTAEIANQLPHDYDQQQIPGLLQMGQTSADIDKRALDLVQRQEAESRNKKLVAEQPGVEADAEGKELKELASQLGATTSPQAYDEILGNAKAKYAKRFEGRTAAQAREFGMTANEQATRDATTAQNLATNADRDKQRGIAQQNANTNAARLGHEVEKDSGGVDTSGAISDIGPHLAQLAARVPDGGGKKVSNRVARDIMSAVNGDVAKAKKLMADKHWTE